MNGGVLCFTSISYHYLDRARVLANSIREYHPDWHLALGLTDREPAGFRFSLEDEPFDSVVRAEDLNVPDLEAWMFKHDVVEICTAVKGPLLARFLAEGWQKVIYLDPDIALFSDLRPVVEALDTYSIVLTPHQLAPEDQEQAIIDNEISSLSHGTYNLGFLAVRNDVNGRGVSDWWDARLRKYCYDQKERGLFVDQKWFDLVPALFDNVLILRDPGYNVASWNLTHRRLSIEDNGIFVNDRYPLRFFHFTKLGPIGDQATARYAADNYEVHEIWAWYRRQIKRWFAPGIPDDWWAYGQFPDGAKIPRGARLMYRERHELQRMFPSPFSDASNGLAKWFEENTALLGDRIRR